LNEVYQYVVTHYEQLSTIGLAAIFVARLVAALTPTKRDDEVTGAVDKGFRRGIELLSGAHHRALVETPDAPAATVPEDDNQIEQFNRVLKQFGAKLTIVTEDKSKGA
jgi:hypothetical protein